MYTDSCASVRARDAPKHPTPATPRSGRQSTFLRLTGLQQIRYRGLYLGKPSCPRLIASGSVSNFRELLGHLVKVLLGTVSQRLSELQLIICVIQRDFQPIIVILCAIL